MAGGALTPKPPWLAGSPGLAVDGVREVKAEPAADIGYFPAVRVNQRRRMSS